ncbi:MAG: LUD domain-containing protein [Ichthyobacteriaceae bacterium]|nr:LUD domain-containing protein [Ichthyobacteriaceae bacterium]
MTTREKILNRIKKGVAPNVDLPDMSIAESWITPINHHDLKLVLESVGGDLQYVDSVEELNYKLGDMFPESLNIYSNVKGVDSNFSIKNKTAIELANIGVAVLNGDFIVEENGAVFISDKNMGLDSIPTITEYLVMVIPKNNIVKTMHQAYKQFNLRELRYGTFISGPSKTADIESTLVFGAHGAKNLTVFMVNE